MTGLTIDKLTKAFGTSVVVSDVSLTIAEGQFVCFLGPSGCGKTTLLRLIAGLEKPSSGTIHANGMEITHVPTHERNFGMVFQDLALFPHLNVGDNISYSLRYRNLDSISKKEKVAQLLSLVALPGVAERRITQLSGGQRQRVAIARALAQEPNLFLMDEPLSALDAKLRDHMQVELRQIQQRLKVTTILVTHDQREAMSISDQIVVMGSGRVQQVGSPIEVYRRPRSRFVADFIGQSNLLRGTVVGQKQVEVNGQVISFSSSAQTVSTGQKVTVCLRPEDIRLRRAALHDGRGRGRPSFVRDVGSSVEVHLETGAQTFVATVAPGHWSELAGNDEIAIDFDSGGAVLLED